MKLQRSNEVEDLFAQVDGSLIHYQRAGNDRPLLLIHGLVGSARNWRLNIQDLAKDATVYAIDLLNMGDSDRISGLDASLEATADTIARWMDSVGLAQADVAAHSHGGAIAMMLAARHPDRVGKLVLFAPANPFCALGHQLIAFYQTRPGRLLASLIPALPRFIKATALGRMYGDPSRATLDSLEGYTAGLARPGSVDHVLQIVQRWHSDMAALRAELSRLVAHPVLLVWGDRDRAVGLSSARQLQELMPQSELLVLPGVGHIAFEEMPEVCNRAMRDWLAGSQRPSVAFNMRYQKEPLRQLEAV
ncbi:MAG: alpha/beta hydrolase [Acidobacteriaceae bacterium]|nr:alpha/beta hydrolase [Acidobacteriaceae bacterium]